MWRQALMIVTRGLVAAAVLAVGALGYWALVATRPEVATLGPDAGLRSVAVFEPQPVPVSRQWRGYGTAAAMDSADVPARVTATVDFIPDPVEPGRAVARGELLVRLDPSDFEQQADIARENLAELAARIAQLEVQRERLAERLELEAQDVALAERELARVEQIFERGAGNPQELDGARRAVIAAKRSRLALVESMELIGPRLRQLEATRGAQRASLRLAEQDLARTRITSPIDGVLQAVDVEVGESVSAGQRVARVVDPERIEVALRLPASARGEVSVGDAAVLRPAGGLERRWSATITRVAPEDDPQTRTMTVFVEVAQPGAAERLAGADAAVLTPGVFVQGTVAGPRLAGRLVVPRRSIRGGRVLVVRDGVIRSAPVSVDFVVQDEFPRLGLPDDQWAVLGGGASGVSAGDRVVLNASLSVLDGERVDPVLRDTAVATRNGEEATP